MRKPLLKNLLGILLTTAFALTNSAEAQTNGEWRTVASGRAFYNTRSDSQASWQIFNGTTQTWTNTQPTPGTSDIATIRDSHTQTANGGYTLATLNIGEGGGALATASITNGVVTSVTIIDPGSSTNIPAINFIGPSTTSATATIGSLKVTGVAMTSVGGTIAGGNAYDNNTMVTIGTAWAPSTSYTVGAQRFNNGNLYTVTTAGTSDATVGGGPAGIGSNIADGTVVWNYSGPAATATATVTNGSITGITITNSGSGYTSIPTLAIAGTGSMANYAVKIGIETINVTNGGSGYNSAPFVGVGTSLTIGNASNTNRSITTSGNVAFNKGAYYLSQNNNNNLIVGGDLTAVSPISFRTEIGTGTSNTNVTFSKQGTASTSGAKMTFNNLTINSGTTLDFTNDIIVLGTLTNNGTINTNNKLTALGTVSGTGTINGSYATTLPVTLTSFSARPESNNIKITWTTATETNNEKFIVEKSTDGQTFTKLAEVKAKGPSAYSVIDNNPANGTNYYRLVQYDLDGKSETFDPKAVNFSLKENISLAAYPNPTNEGISFKLEGFFGSAQVTLTDMQGKVIHKESINATEGRYTLNLKQKPVAGQYALQVISNGLKKSTTVIVL